MSWPTQIWDPRNPNANDAGMAPYAPPADPNWLVGKESGLPDDWQDYDMKVSVWDALENPLYKVAAEANGINWDDFRSRVNTKLGPEDDYKPEIGPASGLTAEDLEEDPSRILMPNAVFGLSSQYYRDYEAWDEDRSLPKPDRDDYKAGMAPQINQFGFSGKTGDIYNDMWKMSGWLGNIDEQGQGSYETTRRGPQGSDYGIDGDIWEHYGLDKAPEAPTQLADSHFSYQENFAQPVSQGVKDKYIDAAIALGEDSNMTISEALIGA